jgi:hypothetical protein
MNFEDRFVSLVLRMHRRHRRRQRRPWNMDVEVDRQHNIKLTHIVTE